MEQDVRIKLLNEHSHEEEEEEDEGATTEEAHTTRQKTSTESLIDKLDQVQSDLSSGFLTGKNGLSDIFFLYCKSFKMQPKRLNNLYTVLKVVWTITLPL